MTATVVDDAIKEYKSFTDTGTLSNVGNVINTTKMRMLMLMKIRNFLEEVASVVVATLFK